MKFLLKKSNDLLTILNKSNVSINVSFLIKTNDGKGLIIKLEKKYNDGEYFIVVC